MRTSSLYRVLLVCDTNMKHGRARMTLDVFASPSTKSQLFCMKKGFEKVPSRSCKQMFQMAHAHKGFIERLQVKVCFLMFSNCFAVVPLELHIRF